MCRLIPSVFLVALLVHPSYAIAEEASDVKEEAIASSQGITFKVRVEGPYTADVPLQIVCYFPYTDNGAKRMAGAPVELDKRLGGVISTLRSTGEFQGDELETLVIIPKSSTIKAEMLLLIGLGDESRLSLDTMERVGRTAYREAKKLNATKVAFAPLLRDQGNDTFGAGEVQAAVARGLLRAYATEKRLADDGVAKPYKMQAWHAEAGPKYFGETVQALKRELQKAE